MIHRYAYCIFFTVCSDADLVQGVGMSDFELLEPTPHLCRKRDTGRIFVLKSFNTRNRHDSSEQTILGILKTLDAPFLPQVYWSFRDENNYHMVMVRYIIYIAFIAAHPIDRNIIQGTTFRAN